MEKIPSMTAQQGTRLNKKGWIYTDPEMKRISNQFQVMLVPFKKEFGDESLSPLKLSISFVYEGNYAKFKTTKPDLDNLEKCFIDAMQKIGFFKNDAQIVEKNSKKGYNTYCGIGFELNELE